MCGISCGRNTRKTRNKVARMSLEERGRADGMINVSGMILDPCWHITLQIWDTRPYVVFVRELGKFGTH